MPESSRRVAVRESSVHGRGLYALRDLSAELKLIEYRGRIVDWESTIEEQDTETDGGSGVTYLFDRGDGTVIDGGQGGNAARFINHSCAPNVEAIDHDGRIWIHTIRPISRGEELFLDYGLVVDDPDDPDYRRLYACHCNAEGCRRTMLAPQIS